MIIDFEGHVIPRAVFDSGDVNFRRSFWREMPYDGVERQLEVPIVFEPERQIETMEQAGVDLQVLTSTAGWHATQDACRFLNDELAELVGRYPRRFVALGHVNPLAGDAALREAERALDDLGLRGIGLPCFLEADINLDSPLLDELYSLLEEKDAPLFIHPTMAPSRYSLAPEYRYHPPMAREYDVTTVVVRLIYGGVLRRHPRLKVVVAHFGGVIMMLRERIIRSAHRHGLQQSFEEELSRFYFDMAGYSGEMSVVRYSLEKVGPEKLLFATDYPYNFEEGAPEIRRYIDNIAGLDLAPSQLDAMFAGNAKKLLRLP